jgi:hypothetical protein
MNHSMNKKGLHELERKAVRKSKRLHKWRTEKFGKHGKPKIGPDDKELAHHFAWTKPETKKQEQRRLAKELANVIRSNEAQGAGAQQIDPSPSV